MSIFSKIGSIFVSIEDFVANLFTSVSKEFKNLDPAAQALFTNIIKWGNLIKGYIASPPSAGLTWGLIITEAESLLGTSIVGVIQSVLSVALADVGILQSALTDPNAAGEALLAHLQGFTGTALGKELFKIVGSVIQFASGLENNEVLMILAWVYKTFFTSTASISTSQSTISQG